MKICVAGQGAFGQKHLDALKRIPEVEVTSLVGGNQDATAEVAKKYGIKHYTGDLSEGIKRADAVILTTPTKMHFRQGEQVMRAGKHVLVEIPISDSYAVQGPAHPELKIAMDMGIVCKVPSGAILTLSLSFNNDGPLGSFFRYICDNGTYKAFYDDLSDGKDNKIDVSKVDVSMDGIELEDREFIAAIKERREPNAALAQLIPCMRVLGKLEQIIDPQRKAHA